MYSLKLLAIFKSHKKYETVEKPQQRRAITIFALNGFFCNDWYGVMPKIKKFFWTNWNNFILCDVNLTQALSPNTQAQVNRKIYSLFWIIFQTRNQYFIVLYNRLKIFLFDYLIRKCLRMFEYFLSGDVWFEKKLN